MGFGDIVNSLSGTKSSANQQYKNQLKLQKDAQEFSKWQMQNAHQLEVQDLKEAGLNPILSAGGGGASAGVSMGSASAGTPSADISPVNTLLQIANTAKSFEKTDAEIEEIKARANNIEADTDLIEIEAENAGTETQEKKNREWWAGTKWGKYVSPVLSDIGRIFGGAGYAAETANNISSAKDERRRKNRGTTETIEHYNHKGKQTGKTIKYKK